MHEGSFYIRAINRHYRRLAWPDVRLLTTPLLLTICSIRASSKGDRGAVGGGGELEDEESPSALLILSGSAAIICSANVSTLASSSPVKRQ